MHLGLDIGYSSLKVAFTHAGEKPHHLTMPVGVSRADHGDGNYFGDAGSGVLVNVDGEDYVAGVQPHMAADHTRTLDRNYTRTPQYRALYHAALASSGARVIERVATGLPVNLFFNAELRAELVEQLQGRHQVTPDRVVEVREAKVYPQPAGTYISYLSGASDREGFMSTRAALVIDPGFFSVDSVVMRHNRPYPSAATTSTEAMSRLLERADEMITKRHKSATATPGLFKATLEERLRDGRTDIPCGVRDIDALPFLERAADHTGQRALAKITSSVRGLDFDLDIVLVAGGGASLYAPAVRQAFPETHVIVVENAPMANADGFLVLAEG
ncbi:ParM/StbA family protein [Modicisalibacter sp. MOD 31.J]|uniref:ParM/StbA family protein n=1 Tax=Modicisalibacter sp. MOD 31.J TaxID=2831897 RepID=UPI001CCC1156|nr:ParM/StbA family protein [Modicisalibacter sp. MOD 31.J]MBZ9574552.1 ParM/StbA family protein [Modicisalibacter sp. MOD 31.J]